MVALPYDSISVLKLIGQTFLLLGLISFIIQWLKPKLDKILQKNTTSQTQDEQSVENNRSNQQKVRTNQQQLHAEKATSYNERILIPRQQEKLKRKQEELDRFLGPAWKGEGFKLGGGENECVNEEGISPSSLAARQRHLPEELTQHVNNQNIKPEKKPKRVIVLPPEPAPTDDHVVVVKLRTPISTICERRFLHTHTIQDLLDYMTTVGYSQTFHTLSTTYPRAVLSNQSHCTLQELKFFPQITLNIEEKEIES